VIILIPCAFRDIMKVEAPQPNAYGITDNWFGKQPPIRRGAILPSLNPAYDVFKE
jgi:hypothetical protein